MFESFSILDLIYLVNYVLCWEAGEAVSNEKVDQQRMYMKLAQLP